MLEALKGWMTMLDSFTKLKLYWIENWTTYIYILNWPSNNKAMVGDNFHRFIEIELRQVSMIWRVNLITWK